MIDIEALEALAKKIPSQGGHGVGKQLRSYSSLIPVRTSIVEVGVWLGAGTSHLAIGQKEVCGGAPIYCYDKFNASKAEVGKAKNFGINLKLNQDTLPMVKKSLRPISTDIIYIKGDIKDIRYDGPPIGMYVDDASKRKEKFLAVIEELEPHFINGTIIVLMDYYFYQKRRGDESLKFQMKYMQKRRSNFEFVERFNDKSSCAAFRYKKGD